MLEPHIKIIKTKFPNLIPVVVTELQVFKPDAVILKEQYYNRYCSIEISPAGHYKIAIFQCDYNSYEKLEDAYLDDTTTCFKIVDIKQTETIINALI